MSRLLLFAVLFACFFYILQASPVPQDTEQNGSNEFDQLANKAKKMFDDAKGAFENANINDALEKAKTFINQAGDNIRKEFEKFTDKVQN